MWRFNLVVFVLLGVAFYQLSGGADYAPRDTSLQASDWRVLRAPDPVTDGVIARPAGTAATRAAVPVEDLAPAVANAPLRLPVTTAVASAAETVVAPAVQVQDAPAAEAALMLPGLTEMIAAGSVSVVLSAGDAAASDAVMRVRVTRVNLRNGPGTDYGVVDTLVRGTELHVIDSAGDWVKTRVADSGRIGWVAANLLSAAN